MAVASIILFHRNETALLTVKNGRHRLLFVMRRRRPFTAAPQQQPRRRVITVERVVQQIVALVAAFCRHKTAVQGVVQPGRVKRRVFRC